MRPPLLLPVPRVMKLETGCFVLGATTRICLMPGCGDREEEAAAELAEAIRTYAECDVFVERLSGNDMPSDAICVRLSGGDSAISRALEQAGLVGRAMLEDIWESLRNAAGMTLRQAVVNTGLVSEDEILDALAQEMGMEKVSLAEIKVTPELLAAIDPRVALHYRVFPVRTTDDAIHLALADPLHLEAMDDLERILGKRVVGLVASETEILKAIGTHYGPELPSPLTDRARDESRRAAEQTTGEPRAEMRMGADANALPAARASREALQSYIREASPAMSLPKDDGYRLHSGRDRIAIVAATRAGLFYGIQTLIQLVRQYGSRLPALHIEDEPDFRYRGFMLDVSRGRVPTLDTLKWLVRTLSHFKINMLQLYIEHTFHFASHPEIGEGCSPLEPEEIVELDRYCRSRHVELVPSLQSFGHMGYILSLPKFRHLAEVERFEDWWRTPWRQRMRGMTITPVDEGTYKLLGELYADFLPNFSSHWFNLNSDETWDLGKGRSREAAEKAGLGRLYLHHIERIAELARQHGRRPMIWADIIHGHPDLIPEVPDDLIFLDWGYSHDSPFGRCRQLAEQKRPFFVCPGTSGWNQVFPDVWNATLNIRRFVAAGKEHGALGVLNTDWGDCGHFNMLGCSLHGAVLGAALSWNEGRPDDEAFDRAFALHAFDDRKGVMGRVIRRAGSLVREKTGKDLKTWELWASPIGEHKVGQEIPSEAVKPMSDCLHELIEKLGSCPREIRTRDSLSWIEISFGVYMLDALVMRAELDHQQQAPRGKKRGRGISYPFWIEFTSRHPSLLQSSWRMRNKPSNLADLLGVFEKHVADAHALGDA